MVALLHDLTFPVVMLFLRGPMRSIEMVSKHFGVQPRIPAPLSIRPADGISYLCKRKYNVMRQRFERFDSLFVEKFDAGRIAGSYVKRIDQNSSFTGGYGIGHNDV
jgi:hypothetical protein